jgi:hypothetical protein
LAADLVARKVNVISSFGHPSANSGEKRDLDDPGRLRWRRRPDRGRLGYQSRPRGSADDHINLPASRSSSAGVGGSGPVDQIEERQPRLCERSPLTLG